MFHPNERFQTFCRFCFKKHEADTLKEAITSVTLHEEGECPKHPPAAEKLSPHPAQGLRKQQ